MHKPALGRVGKTNRHIRTITDTATQQAPVIPVYGLLLEENGVYDALLPQFIIGARGDTPSEAMEQTARSLKRYLVRAVMQPTAKLAARLFFSSPNRRSPYCNSMEYRALDEEVCAIFQGSADRYRDKLTLTPKDLGNIRTTIEMHFYGDGTDRRTATLGLKLAPPIPLMCLVVAERAASITENGEYIAIVPHVDSFTPLRNPLFSHGVTPRKAVVSLVANLRNCFELYTRGMSASEKRIAQFYDAMFSRPRTSTLRYQLHKQYNQGINNAVAELMQGVQTGTTYLGRWEITPTMVKGLCATIELHAYQLGSDQGRIS